MDPKSSDDLQTLLSLLKQDVRLLRAKQLDVLQDSLESIEDSISGFQRLNPFLLMLDKVEGKVSDQSTSEEGDLEIDEDGVIKPEEDGFQNMEDKNMEMNNEMKRVAGGEKEEACATQEKGELQAIDLFMEAIKLIPQSSLSPVSQASVFVNAALQHCNKASELNSDGAEAYRWKEKAQMLLGHWEEAAEDLALACIWDYVEDTNALIKGVQPQALKMIEHHIEHKRRCTLIKIQDTLEWIKTILDEQGRAHRGKNIWQWMSHICRRLFDMFMVILDPRIILAWLDVTWKPDNISKYRSNHKFMKFIGQVV